MAGKLNGSDSNIFLLHEHAAKLLKSLNETRNRPNLCDASVHINNIKIPVQKSVLSAASHYFRALFDYDNIANTEELTSVSLDSMEISEETFRSILDFIYTAEVKLDPTNIQDILQAADQLLMSDLKSLCCEYLDQCMTTQNCIGIYDFTSQLSCSWSHHKVCALLDKFFMEVSRSDEFLALPAERITHFLSRKTLEVDSENFIADTIINWYKYDENRTKTDALEIFRKVVNVKRLSSDFLENLSSQGETEFCNLIKELKNDEDDEFPRGYTQVVVACGGITSVSNNGKSFTKATEVVHCVPARRSETYPFSEWRELAPLLEPRQGHGLVEVGGCLYAAGGRSKGSSILKTCEKYDPTTNTWSLVTPMNEARIDFGLIAIEHKIYAIGGSNDMTAPLLTMEVYDIYSNKWTSLPNVVMKRIWACYVGSGKKIYCLGGGVVDKFYESVEVFDTRSHTWCALSPMRERRCDARAVAIEDKLYVFGGFRRIECPSAAQSGQNLKLCGTELYSLKTDHWIPLRTRHGIPGLCSCIEASFVSSAMYNGEDILVAGELDMDGEFQSLRSFNPRSYTWSCIIKNSPPDHNRFSSCLLSIPTHVLSKMKVCRIPS